MITLAEIRKKYPEYGDLNDDQLVTGLHKKYYPDMELGDFQRRIGYAPKPKPTRDDLLSQVQSGPLDALRPARAMKITAEALASVISGVGSWAVGLVGKQVGTGVAATKGETVPSEFGKHYQEQIQTNLTYQPTDPVAVDIVQKLGYAMWPFQKAGEAAKKAQKALGATPEVQELTGDIVEVGTMGLAGGIGSRIRSITKSRAEAFDLAKTMEKSMQDIVDPAQRKAFVDSVIKKAKETGRDPWELVEETQQSMLPVPAKGRAMVKVERPWTVDAEGNITTDAGVPQVRGMTARDIGVSKRRVNEALQPQEGGESYVKGVDAELAEPTPPRTLTDIVSDINTALGERGSVGEGKMTKAQKEAVARLTADMDVIRSKAREAGLSIKQYLVNEGHPAEIAEVVARHSNVASITTPQTWQSVDAYIKESQEKQKEMEAVTPAKFRDNLVRLFVDRQGNMKRELVKSDKQLGRDTVQAYELINGAGGKADNFFHEAYTEVIHGMTRSQKTMMDAYLLARRQLEISRYKPEHTLNGLSGEAWADYMGKLREQVGEKGFAKMEKAADRYFDRMREGTLDRLLDEGLITDLEYNDLNQYVYEPIKFIEAIDPTLDVMTGGKKGSVMSSGLQELGKGEKALIETRSDVLMQEAFKRTEARIANNAAAKAAYEMARDNPDNGLLSIEKAKLDDPVLLGTMINGERYTFFMDRSIAKEWFNNDPIINRHVVEWAQILSGAWMVRAMATGYNPFFFIRNIPRDVGLIWTSAEGTRAGYSSFLPTYLAQTGINMSGIFMDVIRNRGKAKEFVDNGGTFEFLSTGQGRGLAETAGGRMITQVRTVADAMGWLGQKSEMMTRTALYKQGIDNGLTPKQAAAGARSYLDFSQGGSLVKAVDQLGAPYLNAAVQGTRSIFRGARENPKLFTWKASQLMALASILYLYNHYSNKDAYSKVSDREKVNNFIITTPYQFTDDQGQTRDVYFKIAKDQGQQIFTSMADALMDKYYTGKFPSEQVMESWGQLLAVSPAKVVPPTIQATLGYMTNTDFWRGEPIYRGHQKVHPKAEIDNRVNPVFKWVGAVGLSPKRTEYAVGKVIPNNNPLYPFFTGTVNLLSGDLSKEVRQKSWEQLLLEHPSVRYVAGATDPYNAEKKAVDEIRIDSNTRQALMNYEFDELTDSFIREPTDDNKAKLMQYLVKQDENDQKRLQERFIKTKELFSIPDRRWWINTLSLNPEARAAAFYGKYMATAQKDREALVRQAAEVKGYVTDRFADKMADLMMEKEQRGREQEEARETSKEEK